MADNDKKVLEHRIAVCDFALLEIHLFLDTHPDNQEALAHYQKHLTMRQEAAGEYVRKYGPLTPSDYDGGPRWRWVDAPWPWELPSEV